MSFPTTKTEIAKQAVSMAIAGVVKAQVADQLVDHTELEEDSIAVNLGSSVIGWYVANQVRPVTDKAVDMTINRWKSRKNRKAESTPAE